MLYGHSHCLSSDKFVSMVCFRVKYKNGAQVFHIPGVRFLG